MALNATERARLQATASIASGLLSSPEWWKTCYAELRQKAPIVDARTYIQAKLIFDAKNIMELAQVEIES